jgi:hypothetical protein
MTIFESNLDMMQGGLSNSGIHLISSIPAKFREYIPDDIDLRDITPDMAVYGYQKEQHRTIFQPIQNENDSPSDINRFPIPNTDMKISRIFIDDEGHESGSYGVYVWIWFNAGAFEIGDNSHNIILPNWMKFKARQLRRES